MSGGSVSFREPPAPALAGRTSSAPARLIGGKSSLLGLGRLRPRPPSSVHVHGEETKVCAPLTTPPRRDGHSADTTNSPERHRSATPRVDRPRANASQQTPLHVAADAYPAFNPAFGTGHQLTSTPQPAATLHEVIVPPTDGLVEVDETIEVMEVNRPGGITRNNAPDQATIALVDDLGEYSYCSWYFTSSVYLPRMELAIVLYLRTRLMEFYCLRVTCVMTTGSLSRLQ